MKKYFDMLPGFLKSKWTLGIIAIVIVGGGYLLFHRGGSSYQFIAVQRGSITETVSVTGNTTPMQTVSLGFQSAGTIAHVYYNLGDKVNAGAVIASINTASLSAALQQAQATLAAQQATLEGLQAGSQPADIAASQAALQAAQQNLTNLYAGIGDAAQSAYTKANDAVRTQLSPLFSGAESSNPSLTFNTSNGQAQTTAQNLRLSASTELNEWQQELATVSASSSQADLTATIQSDVSHLQVIQNLLVQSSTALDGSVGLSASELATYKANVTAGMTEVNDAISSLNGISQNIAAQIPAVAQAQANLALKQAGSTPQDIAAQQAQVEEAQAGVASAEANLQNAEIVAPISGTLTQQDAKGGQSATPGTAVVSIIGNSGFEVDAGVSDTDVGKLAIGDIATITLDAFPGETFSGQVFYIAPAQTDTQGVISYLVKISFDKSDPRLKSGLSASIDITAKQDNNVLILPQYAILQNDSGIFVETLQSGTVTTTPVTLGIQDESGNVEVLSGVTEGQQVINIGLKTQ